MLNHNPSSIDYEELGARLRAYRIGASLQAENIADQLGVSRAAIYRLEQGKIVKIETLERLAQLLGTSIASLLGVEVEYYASALGFFERLRQVESDAERIVAHFAPISLEKYGINETSLKDGCTNLKVGAWILSNNAKRLGWNWNAIGAYNVGCGRLDPTECEQRRMRYAWKIYHALNSIGAGQGAKKTNHSMPVGKEEKPKAKIMVVHLGNHGAQQSTAPRQQGEDDEDETGFEQDD